MVRYPYFSCYNSAYDLIEIAELIKEEPNGNVLIESDKNTMKSLMEIKQGAFNFDIENSIAPLLGFIKIVYKKSKNTSQKIVDIMGFSTFNIRFNVISVVKDNGNNTDILYTFTYFSKIIITKFNIIKEILIYRYEDFTSLFK